MLLTNQRIDKLAAARVTFEPQIPIQLRDPRDQRRTPQTTRANIYAHTEAFYDGDSGGEGSSVEQRDELPVKMVTSEGDVRLPKRAAASARYPRPLHLFAPFLSTHEEYIRRFLYDPLYPDSEIIGMDVDIEACPVVDPHLHIKLFKSATAFYHAPSDISGVAGMHRGVIRATPFWKMDLLATTVFSSSWTRR
ncbi:hypothetical protein EST38_g11114 [Candolleomyces aberdarensis]|uniref:Uncharacterized protein n=1 Tax=Candolleomyces aberdarensis TaxID=2316362 RepID=A0A4Q2D6B9_9AGAR|nr:hypothetical protein EST38_g11114 [Candolleomyces aberdarensis]